MPRWLSAAIVGVVGTTAALSVGMYLSCSFYYNPRVIEYYKNARPSQEGVDSRLQVMSCAGADDRALTVLAGLLATLVSLASQPPGRP
jgi:hypothetical protein